MQQESPQPVPCDITALIACEECDSVYQRISLQQGECADCACCGAPLYRYRRPLTILLPLLLTALIIFIICNSFPIVKVDLQGNDTQTTLIGAALAMFHAEQPLVGVLVLITTFIVPLLDIVLLLYVMVNVTLLKQRPQYMVFALRTIGLFRTWGMIEVFLIGVLVTLVKLVAMVVVIPGIALWSFAVLSLLLVYISSFTVKDLWYEIEHYLQREARHE